MSESVVHYFYNSIVTLFKLFIWRLTTRVLTFLLPKHTQTAENQKCIKNLNFNVYLFGFSVQTFKDKIRFSHRLVIIAPIKRTNKKEI